MKFTCYIALLLMIFLISCKSDYTKFVVRSDYPAYGGNNAGDRYSPLDQINLSNVSKLEVAWTYFAGDSTKPPKQIECQPIVVDGILYGTSPDLKLFALEASSGKRIWEYDPSATQIGYNSSNRGLNFWTDGKEKYIYYCGGSFLYCVNAKTGKLVPTFGEGGKVDLHVGLNTGYYDISRMVVTATSPGVIYKDVLVLGSTVSEEGDALPGYVRGFDIHTGKLLWTFHTIPLPGEEGYDTWPPDAYKKVGGANNWSGMVLDEKKGVVFLGTGAPSPNFYGGNREGSNLFSDCILALNAKTGKMKWYFQTISHDVFDWDITSPANLATIKKDGKVIDVLIQATKDGLIYVLDRDTGKPIFPVEERPVPQSKLVGEKTWPTQKFPVKPDALVRQEISFKDTPDSINFPDSYQLFKENFLNDSFGVKYAPPSSEGTVAIGISGGAGWGGAAVDPAGIFYINVSEVPWRVRMTDLKAGISKNASMGEVLYQLNCSVCHGAKREGSGNFFPGLINIKDKMSEGDVQNILKTGRGRMPSFQSLSQNDRNKIVGFLFNKVAKAGSKIGKNDVELKDSSKTEDIGESSKSDFPYKPPYLARNKALIDRHGYPAITPPWGTLNAIDIATGKYLWKVPLGEFKRLSERGIKNTGTPNMGGPLVTAGDLVFISGTEDEKLRAFNKRNGEVVWEFQLPTGAFATPITYEVEGKQYLVIAVGGVRGGHKPGGWYMAFSLPAS